MKSINLIVLLFLISSFTSAPKPQTFTYVFKIGDRFAWKQTTEQTMKQNFMGMEQIVNNNIKGSLDMKVMSLTASGAKIEVRYTNFYLSMKLPAGMGEKTLDSQGDTSKIENKVMQLLLDKPFTLSLTRQGTIDSIEGEENLFSEFDKAGLNPQQAATMKAALEQTLNEASLKNSFEMMFINYPDKPIKTGDTWKNKTVASSGIPTETDNTWTLKDIKADLATVTATGLVSTIDKDKIVSLPNGLKSKFNLAGTQKLTGAVNSKTGWPKQVDVDSEVKGTMNLLAGGMIPQDMEVPIEIFSKSVYILEPR